ncbi:unnamed protein product [Polarella glacialis]|uniref:Uncharacterized protein n=1 Tax=Polarella glacialis TaxID=89957 RepID=A0A813ITW8_POLGL|nr:unnamed protein product [Polarella glacialis]
MLSLWGPGAAVQNMHAECTNTAGCTNPVNSTSGEPRASAAGSSWKKQPFQICPWRLGDAVAAQGARRSQPILGQTVRFIERAYGLRVAKVPTIRQPHGSKLVVGGAALDEAD